MNDSSRGQDARRAGLIASMGAGLDSYGERVRDKTRTKVLFARIARWVWVVLRMVLMVGISFILLYPLLYMLSMSFRPSGEIFDPTVIWIPRTFTLDNFKGAMASLQFGDSVRNTMLISIVSSMIQVVTCSLTGYGFARFKFRGRGLLFGVLLFTIILPPQTIIIPQYLINVNFDFFGILSAARMMGAGVKMPNLLNEPWAFYLPALLGQGIRSGLLIYIYRQFFRGMPKELEDAAYIDGAGPAKAFIRVIAPNSGAAFLTVFLFSSVWYWNDFFFSSMFLSDRQTLAMRLSSMRALLRLTTIAGQIVDDPYMFVTRLQAGCLLTILPVLAVYIIFQRFFTESIEKTGIVG